MKSLRWVLALYLFVLMVAVTYPMGPSRDARKRHYLNDIKPGHVDALVQDVAQNIVMFLPAGYLGILVVGRASAGAGAYLIVVLTCATLSFGIETMQHFFLPWRYSTWIDIVSNTVGGSRRHRRGAAHDRPDTGRCSRRRGRRRPAVEGRGPTANHLSRLAQPRWRAQTTGTFAPGGVRCA